MQPTSLNIVQEAHKALEIMSAKSGLKMPINKGANRALDCSVISYVHAIRSKLNNQPFDTIRCAFQEGGELYPGSNFTSRLHIEICVINQELIKGYFLSMPIQDFNPNLKSSY